MLRINFKNPYYAKVERVAVIQDQQFSRLRKQSMEEVKNGLKKIIIINNIYGATDFYDKSGYN